MGSLSQRKPVMRRYHKLRKEGLCINCGRRKAIDTYYCSACKKRRKKRQAKDRNWSVRVEEKVKCR